MNESIQVAEPTNGQLAERQGELTIEDVLAQVKKIQTIMQTVMKKDEHYGLIPGVLKPSLLPHRPFTVRLASSWSGSTLWAWASSESWSITPTDR